MHRRVGVGLLGKWACCHQTKHPGARPLISLLACLTVLGSLTGDARDRAGVKAEVGVPLDREVRSRYSTEALSHGIDSRYSTRA